MYTTAPDKEHPSIKRLQEMPPAEFISLAQWLIKTTPVLSPADMEGAVLAATDLEEAFSALAGEDRWVMQSYCQYFYEIAVLLA